MSFNFYANILEGAIKLGDYKEFISDYVRAIHTVLQEQMLQYSEDTYIPDYLLIGLDELLFDCIEEVIKHNSFLAELLDVKNFDSLDEYMAKKSFYIHFKKIPGIFKYSISDINNHKLLFTIVMNKKSLIIGYNGKDFIVFCDDEIGVEKLLKILNDNKHNINCFQYKRKELNIGFVNLTKLGTQVGFILNKKYIPYFLNKIEKRIVFTFKFEKRYSSYDIDFDFYGSGVGEFKGDDEFEIVLKLRINSQKIPPEKVLLMTAYNEKSSDKFEDTLYHEFTHIAEVITAIAKNYDTYDYMEKSYKYTTIDKKNDFYMDVYLMTDGEIQAFAQGFSNHLIKKIPIFKLNKIIRNFDTMFNELIDDDIISNIRNSFQNKKDIKKKINTNTGLKLNFDGKKNWDKFKKYTIEHLMDYLNN